MTNDFEVFQEIAKNKGVPISLNERTPIHLDMNMIEASLDMAIRNARNGEIKEKLQRLRTTGSDSQKVEFVMGEGQYYFPEDIEMLAAASRRKVEFKDDDTTCFKICEVTYYVVCRCLGNNEQACFDKARQICTIHCE
jgi:hypothetical protein